MKVLLKGIGGVYNYGCEAIVRGTVNILRSIDESIEIDYASLRVEDDKKRLKDCAVNIIPARNKWGVRNVVKALLNRMQIKNKIISFNFNKIKKYNAVFSIGGDMYTIQPGDIYAEELVYLGNRCTKHSIPYIMWGCSIGPFEKNENIKRIFKEHLEKLPLIVAREQVTIAYLQSMGISKNVKFMFDPAFFVETTQKNDINTENIKTIGINLSPLSLSFLNMKEEDTIKKHAAAIEEIIKRLDANIIMLPHVVETIDSDNDYTYQKKVYEAVAKELKSKIQIVNDDPGFIGIKSYIKQCDIVISARMHCCINSITCKVPTIFLSYSEKSKGMSNIVYGTDKHCIPLSSFNAEKIVDIINNFTTNEFVYKAEIPDYIKEELNKLIKK